MRKILSVFVLLFLIAFICVCSQFSLKSLISKEDDGCAKSLSLGFIIEESLSNNYKVYKNNGNVVGECVCLIGDERYLNKIASKLGFMLTNKYEVNGILVYEGVSPKVNYSLSGSQANVQIAVSNGEITIASPIIYGSY